MNSPCVHAFIALGSNWDDPLRQVQSAVEELTAFPRSRMLAVSRWYQNPAKETTIPQPDFINGVALLETALSPSELLKQLQQVEARHGRMRSGLRGAPRTLDLDLLLYGSEVCSLPELAVPHPRMKQRDFVLYPLQDIAPDLVLPGGISLTKLLADLPREELQLVEHPPLGESRRQ